MFPLEASRSPRHFEIAAALGRGDGHGALELTRDCLRTNAFDQQALSYYIVAATACGFTDDVNRLTDFGRLLKRRTVARVQGYESVSDYHSALLRALKNESASDAGHCRRVDLPRMGEVLARPLEDIIAEAADDYLLQLSDDAVHPVVAGASRDFQIVGWINVLLGGEHKALHLHTEGWLSGAYYFYIGDGGEAVDTTGLLRLGGPDQTAPTIAGVPEMEIHPRVGELLLYPSYLCRRMQPAAPTARSVSVEFYIKPVR